MDRRADAPGEFLPAELATEVRRLLNGSPAVSPELSAWLDHGFQNTPQQGGGLQGQETGASDDIVRPDPQSYPLPDDATDEQNGTGASWEASHEWMANVFGLLDADEANHLGKARLVCSGWAKHVMCMKTSLVVSLPDREHADGHQQHEKIEEETVQKMHDVSRVITKKQLSRLQALEIDRDTCSELRSSAVPLLKCLISAACGGCQELRTLKLQWKPVRRGTLSALRPLLPRLCCFHLTGYLGEGLPLAAFEEALASMSSLKELQLDCTIEACFIRRDEIPGRLIASLPKGLARLSIRNVAFEGSGFESFQCSETLTDLEMGACSVEGPMGLCYAVNLKRLSILEGVACRENELEDILTLRKLEHLGIDRIQASHRQSHSFHRHRQLPAELIGVRLWNTFVQRLPDSLPLLTSLELMNLTDYGEEMVAALGRLTGLTSLNLKAEELFLDMPDIPLVPESLRHLGTLTALRHLSLCGHTINDANHHGFLERALPVLHCLPSLVSLDVGHACWISPDCIPLFPVQLQTLVTNLSECGNGLDLLVDLTAVLAALADRYPCLTSIAINEDHFYLEELARTNVKLLPWLQVDATAPVPLRRTPRYSYKKDNSRGEVLSLLTALEESLGEARPYLNLLELGGQWNSPKNPCLNFIGSGEPWVATALRVSSLCKDIAAAGIKP